MVFFSWSSDLEKITVELAGIPLSSFSLQDLKDPKEEVVVDDPQDMVVERRAGEL